MTVTLSKENHRSYFRNKNYKDRVLSLNKIQDVYYEIRWEV